jgi:hypothetical protein
MDYVIKIIIIIINQTQNNIMQFVLFLILFLAGLFPASSRAMTHALVETKRIHAQESEEIEPSSKTVTLAPHMKHNTTLSEFIPIQAVINIVYAYINAIDLNKYAPHLALSFQQLIERQRSVGRPYIFAQALKSHQDDRLEEFDAHEFNGPFLKKNKKQISPEAADAIHYYLYDQPNNKVDYLCTGKELFGENSHSKSLLKLFCHNRKFTRVQIEEKLKLILKRIRARKTPPPQLDLFPLDPDFLFADFNGFPDSPTKALDFEVRRRRSLGNRRPVAF